MVIDSMLEKVNSVLAIDVGGKYTGVVSYTARDMPTADDLQAAVFCFKDQGEGMNYSSKERTAIRHHSRALDRYRQARKLIYILLSQLKGTALSNDEKKAISSLMRRRGYTRLESEISSESLIDCSSDFFYENEALKNFFDEGLSVKDNFDALTLDMNNVKALYSAIKQLDLKQVSKEYRASLMIMRDICDDLMNQKLFGHKHRKEYFCNIYEDLKKDSRLKELRESVGIDRLYKCIGNVSNLQLRALRWYFNDRKMENGGYYDAKRLKSSLIRAYKFFHYDKENTKNASQLILKLKNCNDILETLCEINPVETIPPYEDQNNRKPPVDQTLLLNPLALDKQYTKWIKWAQIFIDNIKFIDDDLDEIVDLIDRKSRLDKDTKDAYTKEKIKFAYVLQRVFDLSKNDSKDFTKIRMWSQNSLNSRVADVNEYLISLLGHDDLADFESLAKKYYEELNLAKSGLWTVAKEPIFEQSNIHPPLKNKLIDDLVANVLCIHDQFDFEFFKKELWTAKVKGRSSVKSICANIEKCRKFYGNAFNELYSLAIYRKNSGKTLTKEDKDLVKISDDVKTVASFLASKLNFNELDKIKFSNPYSLSQLYNIIENDIAGFSSTCEAVNKENNWRMHSEYGVGAVCTRLAAEPVRPFDGAIRNVLDRQAYEIALMKFNEIIALPDIQNLIINFSILVEENRFEFTASLLQMKKLKPAKGDKKLYERQQSYFISKKERIISDSGEICAYTGIPLGNSDNCEIDHIIPRSATTDSMGTIFNSEFNLIYVSKQGNQLKKEKEYTLRNLNFVYLKKVFGTDNINEIEAKIEKTVEHVKAKNARFLVDLMSEEERICCRHALFMPGKKAYFTVVNVLARSYSTRVNGTQAYLVKSIISNLQSLLSNFIKERNCILNFAAWNIDAKESHEVRLNLAKYNSLYEKKENQPITSHAIDALCVLAAGCDVKKIAHNICDSSDICKLSDPKVLSEFVPNVYEINDVTRKNFAEKENPESRKLFKDTIYAENFIPLLIKEDTVKVGFDWFKNSVEVSSGADKLISLLSPFFKQKYVVSSNLKVYRIDKTKAFDFLNNVKKTMLNEEMKAQISLLSNLYFTTVRKDISSIIDYKEKDFYINLSKTLSKEYKICISSNKSLILQSMYELQKIQKAKQIYKSQNPEQADDEFFEELFKNHQKGSSLNHNKCRRVYSLPVISAPSGGIRIKRRTDAGSYVYQLVAVNSPDTVKEKGFLIEDNKIIFNKPVSVDAYNAKNLCFSPFKIKDDLSESQQFISMNKKISIVNTQSVKIEVSMGTANRRNVFVTIPFEDFKKATINYNINSYLDLKADFFLLNKDDCMNFFNYINDLVVDEGVELAKPRETSKKYKISFSKLGDMVSFYYVAEGSMKDTIQKKFS